MSAIQTFFVRAKHWQVFAVVVGLFCGGQIVFLQSAFSSPSKMGVPVPGLIAALFFYACFVVWYWSMGSFVHSVLAPALKQRMGFFGFATVYPLAYLLLFNVLFERLTPLRLLAIFPFHLLAMFCLFYAPGFVARNLAVAERGKAVPFRDYAGALFLLWFFPIGIWFIQPRINRLYSSFVPANSIGPSLRSG